MKKLFSGFSRHPPTAFAPPSSTEDGWESPALFAVSEPDPAPPPPPAEPQEQYTAPSLPAASEQTQPVNEPTPAQEITSATDQNEMPDIGVVAAAPAGNVEGSEMNADGAPTAVSFFDGFSRSGVVEDFAEVKVIELGIKKCNV